MIKSVTSTWGRLKVAPEFRFGTWRGVKLPERPEQVVNEKKKDRNDDAVVLEGRFKPLRGIV